jgi:hypothetical protein
MDWIGLAHDREKWRALANVVMNLRIAKYAGNLLTSRGHLSSPPWSQ